MSLITRCPACETMFKVVPDQLRISDGWVRCGQCGDIFDASRHLLANPSEESAAPAGNTIEASHDNAPADAGRASALTIDLALPAGSRVPARKQPAPPLAARRDPDPDLSPTPPTRPSEPEWVETRAPEKEARSLAASAFARDQPPLAPAPLPAAQRTDEDAPEVTFMRDGRKSIWQRPMARIILLLLVLLLVAALAAQVLIQERDRIAAVEPASRPALLALCAWTRCALSPLRQIESIAIESSSFSLARGDNFRLAFSLKNNAVLDLAMPAIELTLTDGQDQALIRRVILPAQFGAPSHPLAAGSDWTGSLSLSVKPGANVERIAGYRLLAFYP